MESIRPVRITSDNFSRYGRLARLPETDPLAATDQFKFWSDAAFFETSDQTEIGFCTVFARPDETVAWMERHARTPEVLIPIDGPFVLPVFDGDRVEAFRVEPGEAVVIGTNVWHSACIPVGAAKATYFVIFRRGTPHEDVFKTEVEPVRVALK